MSDIKDFMDYNSMNYFEIYEVTKYTDKENYNFIFLTNTIIDAINIVYNETIKFRLKEKADIIREDMNIDKRVMKFKFEYITYDKKLFIKKYEIRKVKC